MSIRAKIMNALFKRTLKPMLKQHLTDIPKLRQRLGASDQAVPKPLKSVVIDRIDVEGLTLDRVAHDSARADCLCLYFHGGGYVLPGSDGHVALAAKLSELASMTVYLVDYSLGPEAPFPGAVDDALKAYQYLINQGFTANQIIVGGDSAGGGLAAATMLNLKNQGMPQPAAAILLSPWLDLSLSGSSVKANEEKDVMLSESVLASWASAYLQQRDPLAPLASPIYGDLSGLAPMLVHVGSTEILRSDSEDFVDRIIEQGGSAVLKIWDQVPHVFQVLGSRLPEAKASIALLAEYCRQQFNQRS